jgi:hypothetical protein
LSGIRIYAFNSAGGYLGMYADSDADGRVSFHVPTGSYKFRADYLGYQFWSDTYPVPDVLLGTVTIPHQDVIVNVEGLYPDIEPLSGLNVYLFTASGTYLGLYRITDADGRVTFTLPDRDFKVRVDSLGLQFWSVVFHFQHATVGINRGTVPIHVTRTAGDVSGANVYLFNAAESYLGQYKVTDATGVVRFILPAGSFKFRAAYGGAQYWSGVTNVTAGQENPVEISLD